MSCSQQRAQLLPRAGRGVRLHCSRGQAGKNDSRVLRQGGLAKSRLMPVSTRWPKVTAERGPTQLGDSRGRLEDDRDPA